VVSISETLYQDLALVTDQIGASVLCPYFVPTGISQSHRNRPTDQPGLSVSAKPTRSQMISQTMSDKAVSSGKVSAAEVAQKVFDAVASGQFYILSHPHMLAGVEQRLKDIVGLHNPSDPFAAKPHIGEDLRQRLRAA